MPNFYLVTGPTSIVSIVKTGSMPNHWPIEQQMLTCVATDDRLQKQVQEFNNPHSTFILEIPMPKIAIDFTVTPKIDKTCIKRIIVLTRPGFDAVNLLFQGACQKPIELSPNFHIPVIMPEAARQPMPSFSSKRSWQGEESRQTAQPAQLLTRTPTQPVKPGKDIHGFFGVSPQKLVANLKKEVSVAAASTPTRRVLPFRPVINSPIGSISPAKKARSPIKIIRIYLNKVPGSLLDLTVDRIASIAEGKSLLSKVFREAKSRIILACASISYDQLIESELYKLVPEARERGVEVTVYYYEAELADNVAEFFVEKDVKYTRKKASGDWLIADRHFISIAAVIWQTNNKSANEESEGSASQRSVSLGCHEDAVIHQSALVLRGNACELLIDDVLMYFDQKKQSETVIDEDVSIIETEVERIRSYVINERSEIRYLATNSDHLEFFNSIFEMARQRIIICFSNAQSSSIQLNQVLIKRAESRGVDMYFVCEAGAGIENFISQFKSPKVTIFLGSNIMTNTIIVDDNMLVEGCFNWRLEMGLKKGMIDCPCLSLAIKGPVADKLITQFFTTRIGETLNTTVIEQITGAPTSSLR